MAGKAGAFTHHRKAGRRELGIGIGKITPVAKLTLQRHKIAIDIGRLSITDFQFIFELILPVKKRSVGG